MADDDDNELNWRWEVVNTMAVAGDVLRRIGGDFPYPVEDQSDLAGDRLQVPTLWVDTLALRQLKVAVDYLSGIRDLMRDGTQHFAPFGLLRAALEAAATSVWLLESDDRTTRLQRLIGFQISDTNNKKTYQAMLPPEFRDTFDHESAIHQMVADAGVKRGTCKFPNNTSLMRQLDDFPDNNRSLLLTYCICSGFSHGFGWATVGLAAVVSQEQLSPTHAYMLAKPNHELLFKLVNSCVRTIQRAHVLFEIRRTTRLHSIRIQTTVTRL